MSKYICLLHQVVYFNNKLLYLESNLLDVRMMVQNARKQGTVLLQWGLIGFYNINSPTFANKETYFQNATVLLQ